MPPESQIPRHVPCYGKADRDGLRKASQELSNNILSSHSASPNAKAIWAALKSGLDKLAEQFIPHKKLGTRNNPPWIDYQTLKLIKRKDRIHKKMKKTGRQDLHQAFTKETRAATAEKPVLEVCGGPSSRH
jgi:hypothetical protein